MNQRLQKNKDLAELLINSMNDWPTKGQTGISEFVSEIKVYDVTPLTIKRISNKKLNLSNDLDV